MPKGVYTRTEYHKKIIRNSQIGKKLSEEHKRKIGEAEKRIGNYPAKYFSWKGRKRTDEMRKTMSNAQKLSFENGRIHPKPMLGKKHTEETKQKMSITKLTKKGRTEPLRKDERNDSLYKSFVRLVKYRDKGCKLKDENCFGYCIVHHILSWKNFPKERYNTNNGITLCQYHHPKKRIDEQRLIPIFQELVGSN